MNEIKRMLRELQMLLCRKLNIDNTNAKYSDYNENYNKIIFVDPITKKWSLGDLTGDGSSTAIEKYDPLKTYNTGDLFYYNDEEYIGDIERYTSGIYRSSIDNNIEIANSWEQSNIDLSTLRVVPYTTQKIGGTYTVYKPQEACEIGENILFVSSTSPEYGDMFIRINLTEACVPDQFDLPNAEISKMVIVDDIFRYIAVISGEFGDTPCSETLQIDINNRTSLLKDGILYDLISCPVYDVGYYKNIISNSELLADISADISVLLQYDYGLENITNNYDKSIIFDANSFESTFNNEGQRVITINNKYKNVSTYSSEETFTNSVHTYLNESNVLVSKPIYRRIVEFTTTTGYGDIAATGFNDINIFSINGTVKNSDLLCKLGTRIVGSAGSDDYLIYNYDAFIYSNDLFVTASATRPKNTPSLVMEYLPEIDFLITIEYTKISDPETIV